jgi:hypothetical protein
LMEKLVFISASVGDVVLRFFVCQPDILIVEL